MSRSLARHGPALALVVAVAAAGCAAQQVPGTASALGTSPSPAGAPTSLAPGPVTVIALGDSLTEGDGDDEGQGFAGRLVAEIGGRPGREGSTLVNLGQSGWDSTAMVDGQQGAPGELPQAVEAARAAAPGAVLATVLIGSNDLWYVYQDGTDEDAAVATYRANLDRAVRELRAAGAVVVVGLPDDQSVRPAVADIGRLHELLPDVTEEEVGRMSTLAGVLARTAEEVAAGHGVRTVDTNDPFWADPARMAADGIHPNAAGYAEMAARWTAAVDPLL